MSLPAKPPRPKACKNPDCRASFVPQRLGQAVCSPKCGLAIKDVNKDKARKAIDQRERREIKAAKERVKSRADHLQETQVAFNSWVRQLLDAEDWKNIMTATVRQEVRMAEGINGGFVLLGQSTKRMTVGELGELIEFMYSFGAERGVVWTEPKGKMPEQWEAAA